jgi:hypothetical protein
MWLVFLIAEAGDSSVEVSDIPFVSYDIAALSPALVTMSGGEGLLLPGAGELLPVARSMSPRGSGVWAAVIPL